MIDCILGLNQYSLQVNGYVWFHFYALRRAMMNESKRNIQNESICLHLESNLHPLVLKPALDHAAN